MLKFGLFRKEMELDVRNWSAHRQTDTMSSPTDILAHCLAAEQHPHLKEDPEFQQALQAVQASPDLQRQLREAGDFFHRHPVLLDTSGMPKDVRKRIAHVLAAEPAITSDLAEPVLGPWEIRRNFAWAACLVLLLAGMAMMSSRILEYKVERTYAHTLRQMPPQDAFRTEIGRMVDQGMSLQQREADMTRLVSWLGDHGVGEIHPPARLMEMPSVGCATFEAPFGKISVVCFSYQNGVMHLFVADAEEMGLDAAVIPRRFQLRGRPVLEWSDQENLYLLIPQEPDANLPELFL
jgi:hypothetical protein